MGKRRTSAVASVVVIGCRRRSQATHGRDDLDSVNELSYSPAFSEPLRSNI